MLARTVSAAARFDPPIPPWYARHAQRPVRAAARHDGPATSLTALGGRDAPAGEFRSILFGDRDAPAGIEEQGAPNCFSDLNLNQVVAAVACAKEFYRLTGYFHTPLDDVDTVNYRQEVFQDLEQPAVYGVVASFAAAMSTMREKLARAEKARYHFQKQRWFLDAALEYCDAVASRAYDLE